MPDWYSEFLLSRARQAEIACMAEGNRRLAESGLARRNRKRPRGSLRRQLASTLLILGRSFRSPGSPPASGR
jgi:hypothetical protein